MLKGVFWDLIDKVLNQGIGFIISILLARILTPEDFGLVGMVLVLVTFSQVFMDMGFGTALVQKQEVTEEQFSTVFYINITIGATLTVLMFASADIISVFYNAPSLSPLIKGISFLFLINSLSIVQTTHYLKAINLKPPAIIRGVAVLVSGGVGIAMAYMGYGVWSLVIQNLMNALIYTLLIWIVSNWRPLLYFNLNSVSDLWSYGYKILIPSFVDNIFSRLDVLIIGKIFSPSSLGYYTRAQSLNNLVIQYSSGSIMKVFFPAISKYQDDALKVKEIYETVLTIVSFAAFGLLSVLYVSAENIIILLFTEKWLQSVVYFKILILSGYAYPLSAVMVNVISGMGNSSAFLKLDLIKKTILVVTFVVGFQIGITGFLYGMVIFSFIAVLINMYFVQREIASHVSKQGKIAITYFILAAISAVSSLYISSLFNFSLLPMLIIEVGTVALIYLSLNLLLSTDAVIYIKARLSTLRTSV